MILPQQMTQKVLAEQWKQGVQIMYRNQTKEVRIGDVVIGGDHPIAIQSMTNTRTEDVEATVEQILRLEKAGCEIIRCTVPTMEAAKAIKEIKKQIHIPLVADIHFDYKMAIAAIENGADKIRINPGNIGAKERVQVVVDKAKEYNVPIRVGVNSGSLEKHLLEKYGGVTAEGIVESALDKVHLIESMGYDNLVVSIKSSDVLMCVKAHELIAKECPYPLHVGITESGTVYSGNVKSSVGLGIILHEGIGNTIRVSLTGDPVEEIRTAKLILKTLGLRKGGIEVVSCPTCGRTRIDLIKLANQVEEMVADIPLDIKVAVMGCVVNGPGEAKEADGTAVMKQWWDITEEDQKAIMENTEWCMADNGYFRGGGYSSRYETRAQMPATMIRLNLVKGLGPVLQIAEGWTVALPEEVSDKLWKRTDYTWPCTWFAPRCDGKEGPFKTAYDVMNNWGANHGAISYGHIGADLITMCSMLRIPVSMHNVPEKDIYRPAAWNAFGMDKEGADFRACKNYGPLYK